VFQFPVVYDTLTVFENLAFPLRNRRFPKDQIDARVHQVAEMLDLQRDLKRNARGLTADVRQKISLGRGLVRSDVAAILFDEPLTIIDPLLKWELRSKLKALHRELHLTMIYVTHDQTEALTFADTVVVMYEGGVVQIGKPQELFDRPAHTFVGYFIGSPGMNILPCTVSGSRAAINGHAVALTREYPALASSARIELGIRPEFITVGPAGQGLPVRIERVDDLGGIAIARARCDALRINAVVKDPTRIFGEAAGLILDPARVNIYADGQLVA
jgi:glycerol transport system ATP-binding protein